MWESLQHLLPAGDLSKQQQRDTWDALLQKQLAYAEIHGRRTAKEQPCPMKASSTVSLLARTLGMVKKFAPQLGVPPPAFYAEMARFSALMRKEGVLRARPATLEQVAAICSRLRDRKRPRAALFLTLMWVSAGRGTSVLNLQKRHLHVNAIPSPNPNLSSVSMTYVEGKTVKHTGPYTLHVLLPPQLTDELVALQTKKSTSTKMFSRADMSLVAAELKADGLEMRSTRRGALQALARAGASPQEILLFSRHKDTQGLYAYLDDGLQATWEACRMFPWSVELQNLC